MKSPKGEGLTRSLTQPPPNTLRRLGLRVFRFLASLKLAVILLSVLILAAATGTICESTFDTKVARAYIYNAPWFNAWMVLLAVNLFAAAWSRYPWKSHHAGFVITHAGIITLLIGALVGRLCGIEGTMTLFEGTAPSNRLVIDQNEVRFTQGGTTTAFALGIDHPHPPNRLLLGTLPNGWKVTMTDYAQLLEASTHAQSAPDGTPAVQVRLWSGMGQSVKEWLWPDDPEQKGVDLGMLAVETRRGVAPLPGAKGAPIEPPPNFPAGNRAIVYLSADNQASYFIRNKGGTTFAGQLQIGKPVPTSWGDWQLEVDSILPSAVSSTDFKPRTPQSKITPQERAACSEEYALRSAVAMSTMKSGWLPAGKWSFLPKPRS